MNTIYLCFSGRSLENYCLNTTCFSSLLVGDYRDVVPAASGHTSLRIASAREEDSGFYTCTATNAAGTTKEQFRVVVDRGDGGDDGGFDYG